jgi:hypothetical protein
MTQLELKTVAIREDGAFSVLLWDGRPFAVSVERTFEDGKPIIGNGAFLCTRSFYNKGGYSTFEIQVPRHNLILFHKGNWEEDSRGCVIVAESFAVLDFNELMSLVAGLSEFEMEVSGR